MLVKAGPGGQWEMFAWNKSGDTLCTVRNTWFIRWVIDFLDFSIKMRSTYTPPKFQIAPQKWWLDITFLLNWFLFRGKKNYVGIAIFKSCGKTHHFSTSCQCLNDLLGFSTWPPVGFSTLAIKERARTMNHGAETGSMTLLCFRACWCGVVAGGAWGLAKIEPPCLEFVRGGVFLVWTVGDFPLKELVRKWLILIFIY